MDPVPVTDHVEWMEEELAIDVNCAAAVFGVLRNHSSLNAATDSLLGDSEG